MCDFKRIGLKRQDPSDRISEIYRIRVVKSLVAYSLQEVSFMQRVMDEGRYMPRVIDDTVELSPES